MRIYHYLFYKIYQILELFEAGTCFTTIAVMCWLFFFNSCTIVNCFVKDQKIASTFNNNIVVFIILIIILQSAYFYYKGRYLKIIARFENESERSLALGAIAVVIYAILTWWLFFKYI